MVTRGMRLSPPWSRGTGSGVFKAERFVALVKACAPSPLSGPSGRGPGGFRGGCPPELLPGPPGPPPSPGRLKIKTKNE